jgi:tetratricopeptide (TPR) repeat protein
VLGPEHPLTGASLNNLGILLTKQGDLAAARPLLERALAIRGKLDREDLSTASVFHNLAVLLHDEGDFAAAQPLYERALSIREKLGGPNHREIASSLESLAILLDDQGKSAAATTTARPGISRMCSKSLLLLDCGQRCRVQGRTAGSASDQWWTALAPPPQSPMIRRNRQLPGIQEALKPTLIGFAPVLGVDGEG